jgi:hypothetical protein
VRARSGSGIIDASRKASTMLAASLFRLLIVSSAASCRRPGLTPFQV